ncbi:MAG: PDZ domain-containing protein, partial [Methylophilaceae bacterium]
AVIKESAAANAGILRQDRIMKINGIELNTPEEFIKELIKNRGQTVVIDYKRSGVLKNISVQL